MTEQHPQDSTEPNDPADPSGPTTGREGELREDRFLGRKDLTRWHAPLGALLADAVRWLSKRLGPNAALILTLAIGASIAALLTYASTEVYESVTEADGVAALDHPLLEAAKSVRSPGLNAAMTGFTDIAGTIGMPILAATIMVILALKRRSWTPVILILTAATGSLLMTVAGKQLFGRSRPSLIDAVPPYEYSPSFPSGHTLNAFVIAGVVAYLILLRRRTVRGRVWTVIVAGVFAFAVGLSRVYLGHHWFTDVLAAWTLGAVWLSLVITAHRLYLTVNRDVAAAANRTSTSTSSLQNTTKDAMTLTHVHKPKSAAMVINPLKSPGDDFKAAFVQLCADAGWSDPLWLETSAQDPGRGQAREAIAAGVDVVIAAGGDGTVRYVADVLAGSKTPMGVVPLGTGNLLARNLGINIKDPLAAAQDVLHGTVTSIDIVRAVLDHGREEHLFLVAAGLGYDASIMANTHDGLKDRVGWLAYVEAGIRHLPGKAVTARISVDGADPVRHKVRGVMAGNCGKLMGGLEIFPAAVVDDGILDLLTLSPRGKLGWLGVLWRVFGKKGKGAASVQSFSGKSAQIALDQPQEFQLDGDHFGPVQHLLLTVEPLALGIRMRTADLAEAY
ncbi:bifunctional phosphatase PAP2/diacylglycerol kinase family protein [Arthrobacter antibioticus]|uniref:phosphatase PAP2 family protein n=1 Tax=Arthrobacter sp. H35-MC1 TaxID=3046203 RepID=UPI0032D959ED